MLDRSAAETHGYGLPRKVSDHVRHQDEPLRVACAQLATTPHTSHLQVPDSWSADADPVRCRDLNAATSQEVFAGPYLGDAAQRDKFSACFQDMTQGFLAFPCASQAQPCGGPGRAACGYWPCCARGLRPPRLPSRCVCEGEGGRE